MQRPPRSVPHHAAPAGFSLVELVLVLAVTAVLVAQALPAYRGFVLRMHRQEARSALLDIARAQEWHYLANRGYALPGAMADPPPTGLGAPTLTEGGRYALSLDPGSHSAAFTARADATGDQRADTRCASFSIDSHGRREALDAQGRPARECWR
jgi:type IV pilus assembly protein PilE